MSDVAAKYRVGQHVYWRHPEGSGDGIIRRIQVRHDSIVWYEIGWFCWVQEEFILDAVPAMVGEGI